MKKKFSYLFLFVLVFPLFISSCSDADALRVEEPETLNSQKKMPYEITKDEAQIELESIISYVDGRFTRSLDILPRIICSSFTVKANLNTCNNDIKAINRVSAKTSNEGDEEFSIHVFNFSDDRGFALMSGDVRIPSLIALADKGNIDAAEVIDNPGLSVFIEGLESYLYSDFNPGGLDSTHVSGVATYEYGPWENYYYSRDGYCNVAWGQGAYYNEQCPVIDGERAVTGCVATAVAQFMAANKYPASYKNYQFDWNSMTSSDNIYSVPYESRVNIAGLMAELGTGENLNVSYGVNASGAQVSNIPRTMVNFGYANGGKVEDYDTKRVSDELKNGHCVLLSGYADKVEQKLGNVLIRPYYTNGHCWLGYGLLERRRNVREYNGTVCSAYNEVASYILCNWGWNGYHNGYYLSQAFNAGKEPFDPNANMPSKKKVNSSDPANNNNFRFNVKMVSGIRM